MDGPFREIGKRETSCMLTYSVAIRTLGTAGDKFRLELLSIAAQTVQPRRVLVYIAEGYARPSYTIGREEYVWVKKGMMAQRVLPYDEIDSDVIFMLDDDVRLAPDSAEKMLRAMEEQGADCVGADSFKNHKMSRKGKILAAVTSLVFPHRDQKWAFKILRNGSFSYNDHPTRNFYWSQSCGGPALMWRKDVYVRLHLEDEMWLDELPFAYGDDMLESYKLHKNGYKLGVLYDAGCEHLDGKSSSGPFRKDPRWIHTRTLASSAVWWRAICQPSKRRSADRLLTVLSFSAKIAWLFGVMLVVSVLKLSGRYVGAYLRGLRDSWRFVHTARFLSLRSYVLQ